MNRKPLPSQSRLQELFAYDGSELRWARNKGIAKKGEVAGCLHYSGYRQVKVDGQFYRAHRLIWLLVTGEDPGALSVDHKDGNKANNSWDNLRLADGSQQQFNIGGVKGVYKQKRVRKTRWVACFRHQNLGSYDTEEEARTAYLKAYRLAAGEFAHTAR